jgi:hypothetical protein
MSEGRKITYQSLYLYMIYSMTLLTAEIILMLDNQMTG